MRLLARVSLFRWLPLAATFLLFSSCLELTGQRITMRYDEASDRLSFLICYDGIHNSDSNEDKDQAQSEQKLRDFVRDGDVMLLDWFGHFSRRKIQEEFSREGEPPAAVAFAEAALNNAKVTVLGHYRDADGRVGAAQLLVFERASEVVAAANAAINEMILLDDEVADDDRWSANWRLWRVQAARGHAWVRIDGHSLVYEAPMDPAEWARAKLIFFRDIAKEVPEKDIAPENHLWFRLLSVLPMSFEQRGTAVRIRLGDPDAPVPLRVQWRDSYRPNLEAAVAEVVPTALDDAVAERLLGGESVDDALGQVIAWGPVEVQVSALIGVLHGDDSARNAKARALLAEIATRWNGERSAPRAPGDHDDLGEYVAAWQQWYRDLLAWPRL